MPRNYIVGTGWWCDGSGEHAGSMQPRNMSSSFIRTAPFFEFWYHFVDRYTSPERIVIVDSASPVAPPMPNDSRIVHLPMMENFGHSVTSERQGVMSGVERCLLQLMMYAHVNETDLVYIEQDCLVRGEGWLDACFEALGDKPIMYGDGEGTPQPMQQSLMIFRHEALWEAMNKVRDAFEASLEHLADPEARKPMDSPEKRWHLQFGDMAVLLPFEGGRTRPLRYDQPYLYAQHWTDEELLTFFNQETAAPSYLRMYLPSNPTSG